MLQTEVGTNEDPRQTAFKKLASIDVNALSHDQKSILRNRGLLITKGRVLIQDARGNTIDAETMEVRGSPEIPVKAFDINDGQSEAEGPDSPRKFSIGEDLSKTQLVKERLLRTGSNLVYSSEGLNETTQKNPSGTALENSEGYISHAEHQLIRQASIRNKINENYFVIEDEIFTAKPKVMKPKVFEQKKIIVLPTVYSIAEVKSLAKNGKSSIV